MGKAGLLKKLHPLLVLTTIWAISDEQPPSVRYTQGYAELPTALHTFRTDNEGSRVARIFRQEDHCSLPSRLSLCSQKDSKDDKCIGVIKRTLPLQKYEVICIVSQLTVSYRDLSEIYLSSAFCEFKFILCLTS